MPFQSQAQRAFMYSQHPEIAKRWEQLTPKDHKLPEYKTNPQSESNESPTPGRKVLPRLPGTKRDFSHLKPSQSARHSPSSRPVPNEREAMQETNVQFVHGSRHTEFGIPKRHSGLQGRDQRAGERAIVPHKV